MLLGKFFFCKWPNIDQIIKPSTLTGVDYKNVCKDIADVIHVQIGTSLDHLILKRSMISWTSVLLTSDSLVH